jgi:peptide deformylase
MSILQLTKFKDPALRKKSVEIKELTPEIKILIEDMVETLKTADGLGLAAPQVNKNIRLILVSHKDEFLVLINPKIVKKSFRKNTDEEGCLSLPGVFGKVCRYSKVTVKAKNKNFEDVEIVGSGMLARILQHEIDHLDGVLFVDKARKITQGKELLN